MYMDEHGTTCRTTKATANTFDRSIEYIIGRYSFFLHVECGNVNFITVFIVQAWFGMAYLSNTERASKS